MAVAVDIVGRAGVMSQIDEAIRSGRAGTARVLSLIGAAGSGKSTLVEAAARMANSGDLVLRATGHPAETELPYAALHQLLRPIESSLGTTLRGALALEATVPGDRMTIAASLLELFSTLASDRFTLLLVDDVHWIDVASRQALTFCARRLDADAVTLVMSGRATPETTVVGTPVVLDPLDDESALAILRDRHGRLHTAVAERIIAAAEGLPLALIEIGDALNEDQRSGAASLPDILPVGPTIGRLHAPRLDRLDDRAVRALVIVALEPGTAATLTDALQAAGLSNADLAIPESLGLVRLADGHWTFSHPTVRSAVLERADASLVRASHVLLAARTDGAVRAWHLHRASTGPDPMVGAALAAAAEQAETRGALVEAADCWIASITHTPVIGRQYAAMERAAECLLATGMATRAGELIERLIEAAPAAATRLRWQGSQVGLGLWLLKPVDVDYAELVSRAARIVDGADADVAEDALTAVAVSCYTRGLEPPDDLVDLMRNHGRRGGRTVHLVDESLRGAPAAADALAGPWVDGLVPPRSMAETAGIVIAAYVLLWLDRIDDCQRLIARLETFDLPPLSGLRATSRQLAAICALRRGEWVLAELELASALRIATDGELATLATSNQLHQAQLAVWRGHYAMAERLLEEAESRFPIRAPWAIFANRLVRAAIRANAGEYADAAALYAEAESVELDRAFGAPSLNCRLSDHVAVLARLGRTGEARAVIERYRAFTAAHRAPTSLGAIELELGRLDRDVSAFERALAHFRAAVSRFDEARCLLVWGETLRRRRQRGEAAVRLSEARTIFAALHATPWEARARTELAACGVRRIEEPIDPALAVLTPREYEIARIVASGLTNAEAAQRLFISARTVGYHLANTYQKLGLRGRDELGQYF